MILVILIVGFCIFYYFSNDKEPIIVIEKGESVGKIKEEINPYQELIDIYEQTCMDGEMNKLILLAKLIQIENAH